MKLKSLLPPFAAGVALTLAAAAMVLYCRGPAGNSTPPRANWLPPGAATDTRMRLTAWPGKVETTCPPQTPRTAVLVALGQSNAGNHGGERAVSKHHSKTFAFFNGKCFEMGSPLLGSSGQGGEPWTHLADRLISAGKAENVLIAPLAVSGSSISRWAPGGDLNDLLVSILKNLSLQYQPTHVLWVQGESDFARSVGAAAYLRDLAQVIKTIRDAGVTAGFYVAVSTKCVTPPAWTPDNPVALAQKKLYPVMNGVFHGPDLDGLLDPSDRHDGCHLSASGLEKSAVAWASSLSWR